MNIQIIPADFSICKVADYHDVDLSSKWVFIGSTDEEKSLVCPTPLVPSETLAREDGWRAFRIEGILDFSLIGILAKISQTLADKGIGLFAISTFNSDYILVKSENLDEAIVLARKALEAV